MRVSSKQLKDKEEKRLGNWEIEIQGEKEIRDQDE